MSGPNGSCQTRFSSRPTLLFLPSFAASDIVRGGELFGFGYFCALHAYRHQEVDCGFHDLSTIFDWQRHSAHQLQCSLGVAKELFYKCVDGWLILDHPFLWILFWFGQSIRLLIKVSMRSDLFTRLTGMDSVLAGLMDDPNQVSFVIQRRLGMT